jgi:hypothetical protein
VTLVHWDDVEGFDIPGDMQPLGGQWQRLADAAGSVVPTRSSGAGSA